MFFNLGLPVFTIPSHLEPLWPTLLRRIGCEVSPPSRPFDANGTSYGISLDRWNVRLDLFTDLDGVSVATVQDFRTPLGHIVAQTFVASGARVSLARMIRPRDGLVLGREETIEDLAARLGLSVCGQYRDPASPRVVQLRDRHRPRLRLLQTLCALTPNDVRVAISVVHKGPWWARWLTTRSSRHLASCMGPPTTLAFAAGGTASGTN